MSPLCSLMIALKGTVYAVLLIAVVRTIKVKFLTLESLLDTTCHRCAWEGTPKNLIKDMSLNASSLLCSRKYLQ